MIGIDWRGSESDWGILRLQKLYLYANGTKGFNQSRLREKFWIARSVLSGPLDHVVMRKQSAREQNSDGLGDKVLALNSDIKVHKHLRFGCASE